MELSEIISKKHTLSVDVSRLISAFIKETGVAVTGVDIEFATIKDRSNGKLQKYFLTNVNIKTSID